MRVSYAFTLLHILLSALAISSTSSIAASEDKNQLWSGSHSTTVRGQLPALERDALNKVQSWGYQLQALDPKTLATSSNDLLVVDYSRNGTKDGAFTETDLDLIRRKPDGTRRVVLAYLSIGEAENYRDYWQDSWRNAPPSWLKQENKNWCGNHIVQFWHPEWHSIIYGGADGKKSYVDKIVEAGFDGIYLDRVDVYSELETINTKARHDMIEFVRAVSTSAKQKASQRGVETFFVVAQNAEELLSSDSYRTHIDGLGKEDLLYGAREHGKPNSEQEIEYSAGLIDKLLGDNKPVFGVEYLHSGPAIEDAKTRLSELGLIPLIAPRALDKDQPSYEASITDSDTSILAPRENRQDSAQSNCADQLK